MSIETRANFTGFIICLWESDGGGDRNNCRDNDKEPHYRLKYTAISLPFCCGVLDIGSYLLDMLE
jgi:hypothetical protein